MFKSFHRFNFFLKPDCKSKNYYDIARFSLTWNINSILMVLLPILAFFLYRLNADAAFSTVIGFLCCVIILFLLQRTRLHYAGAIFFSIIGTLLCQYTLNFYPEAHHFVDVLWITVVILYTYFTLEKLIGRIVLVANAIGVSYFLLFGLNKSLSLIDQLNQSDIIVLIINYVVCSTLVAYVVTQFIKTSYYAENKYIELNKELQNKNDEKAILLKEIHHRVKNNLQVVTSLLRLQSNDIDDPKHLALYKESIGRVAAMALIHEKIYQSPDLTVIDLEQYTKSLAADLINSYAISTDVELIIKSNMHNFSLKSLVPLALIFNELISNSLKHGFKNRSTGMIIISIRDAKSVLLVDYSDNGEWIDNNGENSLGTDLIDSLTEQLTGSYKLDTIQGTSYKFEFVYD